MVLLRPRSSYLPTFFSLLEIFTHQLVAIVSVHQINVIVLFLNFQAVIKQFGGTGYESSDVMVIDEVEMQRHQQLEKLYRSTRAGKVYM